MIDVFSDKSTYDLYIGFWNIDKEIGNINDTFCNILNN
jgi:hypothetical protein